MIKRKRNKGIQMAIREKWRLERKNKKQLRAKNVEELAKLVFVKETIMTAINMDKVKIIDNVLYIKCFLLAYTDSKGNKRYSNSVDEKGCTYSLVKNAIDSSWFTEMEQCINRHKNNKKYNNWVVNSKQSIEEEFIEINLDKYSSYYYTSLIDSVIDKRLVCEKLDIESYGFYEREDFLKICEYIKKSLTL